MQGSYDLGRNGALRFTLGKEVEDVTKIAKHSSDDSEPVQTMRRRMDRDKYALQYTGSAGRYDWTVDFTYVKLQENESGIGKWMKGTSYTGTNVLLSLNDIEHRQWELNTNLNIAASRNHLLTVGVGYRSETGKGSRIQDAPKSYKKKIRADDYDGSLYHGVDRFGKMADDGMSAVHDYKFSRDAQGNLHWDEKYERYGTFNLGADGELTPDDFYNPANEVLFHLPDGTTIPLSSFPLPPDSVYRLYMGGLSQKDTMGYFTVNGCYYNQEFDARTNRLTIGEATLNKWHAYISDAWQLNKDTLLAPILRLDHSDLFGSHVTAGIGLTHNVGGDPHRRFKANLATGYAEPGMGELYYNWEMYSSMGDRPGWYWGGNSRLKPEKSVNLSLSLEGESRNTFGRVTLFHNRIKDYLTHYFTGHYLVLDGKGYFKDRLYSFRNLGSVTLTGIEAEVRHRFSPRWEGTLGYAYLQALNRNTGENGMPRRLLDRPRHKIDIGVHYTDEQTGWSGSLWADYYLSMLDSNAVDTSEEAQKAHIARYAEKSFSIWNLMVQKKLGPDALVYFGIDNLFAKRDDDRAFPGRRYRLGMNLRFDGASGAPAGAGEGAEAQSAPFAGADWFIRRDTALRRGEFRLSGDYRLRHDSHTGEDRGTVRVTETRDVGDAADILADRPAHGHAQRLRVQAAAGLGGNTEALVTAHTGSAPDVRETIAAQSGLAGGRLERAELRRQEGAFDISLGRLEERIGVTGYFFGRDYDGARVVWTDARTQVRLGGGNFSRSTGIKDTPPIRR